MPSISKDKRDKIVAQALNEIQFARTYKQGKVKNWQKNEDLYYGKKIVTNDSRANVDLGRMQEFVHTLLSKIDNPLVFKFSKRKESQYKRVKRLNALRAYDSQRDFWDLKDIVGKKQGIIYGRAIYAYHADSYNGYCPHLENVDVYDFLIDPSAGGIDLELAMYMGRYGVVKTKSQLRQGVKDGLYLRYETNLLLEGAGNASEATQEETNKSNRSYDQNVFTAKKEIGNTDKYKFWEWYTTYDGERYYLLLEPHGTAIRIEKLTDIFPATKDFPLAAWPFWTWAAFPDLTEFWTPSYCDYVREIFMVQSVNVNQMLDNAEQINKPQRVVNVGAVENLAELKYRKEGYIKVKAEFDVDKAVQTVKVPVIDTPLKVFQLLETIQEKSSGVTAGAKGVSEEDKVAVYEGNQANSADRFGLLNKSYSFGYRRFAKLYEYGVREHLTKKVAVDILGPNGVTVEQVSKADIFWKTDEFGVIVEASNAELALSESEKRTKIAFLQSQGMNPIQSPKKAYEIQAGIAGFDDETIRQLMDTSEFGDAELMAEAERDIELILEGKPIKPNPGATNAYKQRFVDYMQDNQEDLSTEQFTDLANYVSLLNPIIAQNSVRQLNKTMMRESLQAVGADMTGQEVPETPPELDINKIVNTQP